MEIQWPTCLKLRHVSGVETEIEIGDKRLIESKMCPAKEGGPDRNSTRKTYADPSWARIATLVPAVISSTESGDEVANKILHNSALELADGVKTIVQRLRLCGKDEKQSFPLVMVGGVLANKGWDITQEIINKVSVGIPGVQPIRPEEIIGSTCTFVALYRSMMRLKRYAVAFYGNSADPQLVALIA